MIWTFHRRLWVVALVHTFIGEAGPFLFAITNYFQPFVMSVANASIHDHYGVYLNEQSYAWTWSTLSALDVVGNFVGRYQESPLSSHLSGALTVGQMLNRFGRKTTVMVIRNILSVFACVCLILAQPLNTIEFIGIGRFTTGSQCTHFDCPRLAIYRFLRRTFECHVLVPGRMCGRSGQR
jgi:MFS family permease